MGKSHTRVDKTCLNCNHVVEKRFCGNCGQENIETRKTFHHLFVHFFEDLTHYENSFWKTIRNLIARPSSLSKEYLSGKRMSYLAPVRLYIFISFVTFFLFAMMPSTPSENTLILNEGKTKKLKTTKTLSDKEKKLNEILESDLFSETEKNAIKKRVHLENESGSNYNLFGYKSVAELDSIQKFGHEDDKLPYLIYVAAKKSIHVSEKFTPDEIGEKLRESILHNFPKVLIIYMPLFALFLWLFHNKKRWYYFDHGIFTLHYFSFLLLIGLILFIISKALHFIGSNGIINGISLLINIIGYAWMIYYFFPAHHRFYGETRLISLIKSIFLFIINIIFMCCLLLAFFVYSLVTIH